MDSLVQNNKDILLSIIIPVYNTEKYLKRCLDSVLKAINKITNSEIIVVNDGSPGNTDEIMDYYLKKYNKVIRYYKKENAGLADTKNFGLEKAFGEYITFVDSDDFIDENYYTDVLCTIKRENCDVVVCDFETHNGENSCFRTHAKNPAIQDDKWGCIDISIMPSSCNKVVKRDLYDELRYPIGLLYEDLATTLIILLKAKKIVYIPKMYYKYCIRENSIMRNGFNENKFKIIEILEILFSRIDNLNISSEDKNRAKSSVCFDRIYFELLEPLSKVEFKIRYKLTKIMCKNSIFLIKELNSNEFYKDQLKQGRIKRRIYSNLINFSLNHNFSLLLCKIVKSAVYYNNEHINDRWRKYDNK